MVFVDFLALLGQFVCISLALYFARLNALLPLQSLPLARLLCYELGVSCRLLVLTSALLLLVALPQAVCLVLSVAVALAVALAAGLAVALAVGAILCLLLIVFFLVFVIAG